MGPFNNRWPALQNAMKPENFVICCKVTTHNTCVYVIAVSIACLFLATSCKPNSQQRANVPNSERKDDSTNDPGNVARVLKDFRITHQESVWKSPLSSDEKYWYWGMCSTGQFREIMGALKLDPKTNIWERWPGAYFGPPLATNWGLVGIPTENSFYRDDFTNGATVFATYTNNSFFIIVRK